MPTRWIGGLLRRLALARLVTSSTTHVAWGKAAVTAGTAAVVAAAVIVLAASAAGLAQAPPSTSPTPTPDLTPRALEPEELDPVTLARMGLRYQLDQVALEVLAQSRAPALVLGVALQGQTIFLEAYGSRTPGGDPVSLDDPLWLASLTKPLTAVGILRLAARGALDLAADAAGYLPPGALGPPADPAHPPVTLRHLLTHTAGLDHRSLGLTAPADALVPASIAEAAAGLPPRVFAPGSRLSYCSACYLALSAVLAGAVDGAAGDDEAAYRLEVFEPLGMARASVAVGADPDYEAATLPPHAHTQAGLQPVEMPLLREVGAGRARASAHDVMAFAEALTAPEPPDALAGGVREALLGSPTRVHPALPGWTAGMAESVVLGHPVVRHDGDLPGTQASLVVVPDAGLSVFAYLNADPFGDGLLAASGLLDARAVLIEAVLLTLLGDARAADAPERGWPAVAAATNPPPTGTYRLDRYPHLGAERLFGPALLPFALHQRDQVMWLTPPAGLAETLTFVRANDGVWRSERDGAPLVATRDAAGAPLLLAHLGITLTLEPIPWFEHPAVTLGAWGLALAAAAIVLLSWPIGAFLRWRRREPRDWDRSAAGELGRALRQARRLTRVAALLVLAVAGLLGWLVSEAFTHADAPLHAALPVLHVAAALLALTCLAAAWRVLHGFAHHPQARWRWTWQGVVALVFAAAFAQGWIWQLWSPATVLARWLG